MIFIILTYMKSLCVQILKGFELISFLENQSEYQYLLQALFSKFEISSKYELFGKYLPLIHPFLSTDPDKVESPQVIVEIRPDREEVMRFIRRNIANTPQLPNDVDFLHVRKHPIIEVEDGVFRIVFLKFLVERMYKGLLWGDLREIADQNKEASNSFLQFKNDLGEYFVEQVLLYNVLGNIFYGEGFSLTGEQIKEARFDGGVDFYHRQDKNILLFECKDLSINAESKQSASFIKYENVLRTRLSENESGKRKGVKQLIYNIRALLECRFPDEPNLISDCAITPILVLSDSNL